MSGRDELLNAIGALEAVLEEAAITSDDKQKDNRIASVKLRRLIAEKVGALGLIGDQAFSAPHQREAFRKEYAAMRTTFARHQASWPIVVIDRANPDYLASLATIRESNRKFIAWIRAAVAAA